MEDEMGRGHWMGMTNNVIHVNSAAPMRGGRTRAVNYNINN